MFPDFRQKFVSRCLPMALTIAQFIIVRHVDINRRYEENVYAFGIQVFGVFISNLDQILEIVSNSKSIQLRIPAAFINFDKAYFLNP
jgi:hypothetical protein